MLSPIEITEAFFAECALGRDAMQQALRRYFTSRTIWENVGIATTVGIAEALGFVAAFEAGSGAVTWDAEILAIAEVGDRILTERIDHLVDASGARLFSVRLMGILEIVDGKILTWRDYFDSAALGGLRQGAADATAVT